MKLPAEAGVTSSGGEMQVMSCAVASMRIDFP
jgi:hypothetical protein